MDNPSINKNLRKKSLNKPLTHSLKNTLTANEFSQQIEQGDINTQLIQLEMPLYFIKEKSNNSISSSLFPQSQGAIIGLTNYHQKGRIATMASRELFELGLSKNSSNTLLGRVMFDLFSWLIGKPRLPGENEKSDILNLSHQFFIDTSKSPFDENHNLYIDNFDSNIQWKDGVIQSTQQIEDALLPEGQWHRHYSCILLPANANDLQVKLIRRCLEETNISLIIIFDQTTPPSKHVIELLSENQLTIQSVAQPPKSIEQTNFGLSLTVNPIDKQSTSSLTKFIVPQLNFSQLPVNINSISESLSWLYEGFIELSEEGTFIFGADTEKPDQIIIEFGQQVINLNKDNNIQTIKHKNFISKSKIPIKIKVKTVENSPSIRLFWRRPNATLYQLLPENVLSHDLDRIAMKPRKRRQTTPVRDILVQHPFHQVIKLPGIYSKQLIITDDIAAKADSFSIKIKNIEHYDIVDIQDVKLAKITSGEQLAQELENSIKKILPEQYFLQVNYINNKIKINCSKGLLLDNLVIYHYPKKYLKTLKTSYIIRTPADKHIHDIKFNFPYDEIKKITYFSLQFLNSKSINFDQLNFANKNQFLTPQLFAEHLQRYIHEISKDDSIKVSWNEEEKFLHIEDHQLRELKAIDFGHYDHPLPLIYATSNEKRPNNLIAGAIQGQLPFQQQILSYDLVESPKFGHVTWDKKTGEWSYQPYSNEIFRGFDQFHFKAIGENGIKLPSIGISLQSERPPTLSIAGKKIFTIADPIYIEPPLRYQPTPTDMIIHNIYLAQTHLLKPDDPYLSLTAERWVLFKLDVTSKSLAPSPDFVAIVKDKKGKEIGRVVLSGAKNLPSMLISNLKVAEIRRKDYDANSYSAPIKSTWIKPGIQIQLVANNKPVTMSYTDDTGHFSPNVQPDQHIISRLWNHSYYQTSQGRYPYSMLSWGQEALAKLPIKQLTLYSHPTYPIEPTLFNTDEPPINPMYENTNATPEQQNNHTYFHSNMSQMANGLQKEITYISRYSKYGDSILGLGATDAGYGGGISCPSVLWHESFGHGLGLYHTTDIRIKETEEIRYPHDSETNGANFAFDQINDVYLTHYYFNPQSKQNKPMHPSMYPLHETDGKLPYAAFKPHSDYHTHRVNKFFIKQLRWQPNAISGIDSEDGKFAGEGYYQRWDIKTDSWITLTASNFSNYYSQENISNLAHQRDVAVYWLTSNFTQYSGQKLVHNSDPYPLSQLNVVHTVGNLPDYYYNFKTNKGRPYNHYQPYALKILYSTVSGLLSEILQLPSNINLEKFSMNIADKGELVSIELIEAKQYIQPSAPIYTYLNPQALANTVFSQMPSTSCLILPDHWNGNTLFWAATDRQLIDKSTGKLNYRRLKPESAIKASWVEKGKYHQRLFSLENMNTPLDLNLMSLNFHPLNHEKQLYRNNKQQNIRSKSILTESKLVSGTYINEYIDISADKPPEAALYWVKLLSNNSDGNLIETDPLESWYIYRQNNKLVINGVVDSTPGIELAGLRIYSDVHLLDKHAATSITLYQKTFFERYILAKTKEQPPHQSLGPYTPIYERTELFDMDSNTDGQMSIQIHQPSMASPLLASTFTIS